MCIRDSSTCAEVSTSIHEHDAAAQVADIQATEMEHAAKTCLESLAKHLALGGRSIAKIVRVARTIADLAEHPIIKKEDVLQASYLRNRKSSL